MRKNDRSETSGVGQLGQSVQVAGDAFELDHTVEMLAPYPLLHSAELDQFADDLGGLFTRLPGEGFQLKVQRRIEPCADDVFLLSAFADFRASALVVFSFHGEQFLRVNPPGTCADRRERDGFCLQKHKLASLLLPVY